jgi:hypothetical protein
MGNLNRHFSKDIQMVNTHMDACSCWTSMNTRKIKPTTRSHFKSMWSITIIKNNDSNNDH